MKISEVIKGLKNSGKDFKQTKNRLGHDFQVLWVTV